MNSFAMGLVSFCCIAAGTELGFYLSRRLPVHHLSAESRDGIKMAWGIVATMSALALGLLLASSKNSFDTITSEITQASTKMIVLDRTLRGLGPLGDPVRKELRGILESRLHTIWGDNADGKSPSEALEENAGMENMQAMLYNMAPQNDVQRVYIDQCRQLCNDVMYKRWLIVEEARVTIPPAFFIAMVSWLTLLFTGIGLFAPRNRTVLVALILCNVSVTSAVYLISEANHPLDGIIRVSSEPIRKALQQVSIDQPKP